MAWRLIPRAILIRRVAIPVLAVVIAAALILFLTGHFGGPRININPELEVGMTEEEVASLLGGPPNSDGMAERYYDGYYIVNLSLSQKDLAKTSYSKQWESEKGLRKVYFDKNGRFVYSQTTYYGDSPPTFSERVLAFFRSLF